MVHAYLFLMDFIKEEPTLNGSLSIKTAATCDKKSFSSFVGRPLASVKKNYFGHALLKEEKECFE